MASVKRSFFKAKTHKTYLRSSILQERMNDLKLLSLKKELIAEISAYVIIDDFASRSINHF